KLGTIQFVGVPVGAAVAVAVAIAVGVAVAVTVAVAVADLAPERSRGAVERSNCHRSVLRVEQLTSRDARRGAY
ncbi:MAG: hypothetical protein WCE87_09250, partial [Candidatus Udaeobacter sp.]